MGSTLTLEDVTVTPCGCGRLVRLTHRWWPYCRRCDQPIPVGPVGPLTADDCPRGSHGWATWDHQHGCGGYNSPLEVTVYLDEHADLDEAVAEGLRLLTDLVEEDKTATRADLLHELADLADRAVEHLPDHGDGCDGCVLDRADEAPGAYVDPDGRVVAWTWDATSWTPDEGVTSTLEVVRERTARVAD